MWCGGMKIATYSERRHRAMLDRFFAESGIVNNDSMEALGFEKRENPMMFLTIDDDRIVGMCYAHDFSEYYPNSYRIFTRTATLPEYRGRGFPRQRSMVSAAGISAYTTPLQVDYALINGAKTILFTTNAEDGMESSRKLGSFLEKVEPIDPRFSYYDEGEIYGCKQKVWRLHYRDIINLTGEI